MLREDRISWQFVDGEIIVLDLAASSYLQLNETAALLWRGLAEGRAPEELAAALVATYGIDGTAADDDVREFLDDLEQRGLLARSV